jgi:hypothetical protein
MRGSWKPRAFCFSDPHGRVHCCTVVLLYRCTVVLLYCSTVVPLYRCAVVLLYHCTVVPLYCCTFVPLYCCTFVQLYCCTFVPLYCCTVVLMYRCTVVPLYCCTVVPLYCCTFILLHCCTAVLFYCCTVVPLYCCKKCFTTEIIVAISSRAVLTGRWVPTNAQPQNHSISSLPCSAVLLCIRLVAVTSHSISSLPCSAVLLCIRLVAVTSHSQPYSFHASCTLFYTFIAVFCSIELWLCVYNTLHNLTRQPLYVWRYIEARSCNRCCSGK